MDFVQGEAPDSESLDPVHLCTFFPAPIRLKNVLFVGNTKPPRGLDPALSRWCSLLVRIFINTGE